MSNETRDCKNCIHKVPVFDEEEGIWRGADCDAWECRFVSRAEALKAYEGRPQGECRTCKHRDPDNRKCDCGALERQGCPFPVNDNYFCKYYAKMGGST